MNREIECFGCTVADLRESVESSLTFKLNGYQSVAMSLLSDSQEVMLRGDTELARQVINQAKWVISNYRERK